MAAPSLSTAKDWKSLQEMWMAKVRAAATSEQREQARLLANRGFTAIDVFALVYAWESNVVRHFWEVRDPAAMKLSLREAVVYSLQVALGYACEGSTKVKLLPAVADKLRSFILKGIELGHVVSPTKKDKGSGKPRVPKPEELNHLVLTQIHEAVRRDPRLNGGVTNSRKNEEEKVHPEFFKAARAYVREERRKQPHGHAKQFEEEVRASLRTAEKSVRAINAQEAEAFKAEFMSLLKKHMATLSTSES